MEVATAAEVAMAVTVVEAVVTGAAVMVAAAVPEAIGAGATVIGSGALIRAPVWLTLSVALRTLSASEKRWRAN